jgi:hypothetical protein
MSLDEPFPLNLFPFQVRTAILDEFAGRCPSVREVAEIPDARWLATPGIGAAVLKRIRGLSQDDAPPTCRTTDTELLGRLAALQEELKLIQSTVRMGIPRSSMNARSAHRRLPIARALIPSISE